MKLPTQLHRADYHWTTYGVIAPPEATIDDVTAPSFWEHVRPVLKTHDVLSVVSDTCEFEVRMRVEVSKAGVLKLRVLDVWGDEPAVSAPAESAGDDLVVEFAGRHKWRIQRKSTKEVLSHGHTSRQEALDALAALNAQAA